jgi:hypothetical protein
MDMKFGSSPGACLDRRELLDICLHARHLKAGGLQGSLENRFIGAFLCTWRKKDLEIFMAGLVLIPQLIKGALIKYVLLLKSGGTSV